MQFSEPPSEASRPFLTWQTIVDWAQTHYRDRIFRKDERIPARPELLYLVNQGAIRLVGTAEIEKQTSLQIPIEEKTEEAFLGFVGAGQPFEIVAQSSFTLHAYAHVDHTHVIWLYWQDLDNWPHFRKEVYEALRYQHQRKLLWLSALGQKKTIDRLLGFLTLLIEEYGTKQEQCYCLPYSLTHAQIGSAIGSTRVTVTRLMGKLRRQGLITIRDDNCICLVDPHSQKNAKKH